MQPRTSKLLAHDDASGGAAALIGPIPARYWMPPLPEVASHAMILASSPRANAVEVAHAVEADPTLACRVMKIASSVVYAPTEPPRTVQAAILRVGFQALRRILIAASTSAAYRAERSATEDLWVHALLTALVADELAALAHHPRGGPEFLAAILHDIGRLVLHLTDPQRAAEASRDDDGLLERRVFGISHEEISAYVAQKWGLDRAIVEAILTHHRPEDEIARRIAAAEQIADAIENGSANVGPPASDLTELQQAAVVDLAVARFRTERALFE
ncbi:MAG TPA: HDOD domain-containing protein [Candidatus Binatia bacterium]